LIGVCIIVANLPYLIGWFDPNPMLSLSGLGVHIRPGFSLGRSSIDDNSGTTSQALAHRVVLDWLHGQVPWWNPFEGLGSPLAGEMQCAAFFPFIILLLFSNGQLYLYLILELIAAYSTYFLLRRLSISEWAAFVGAVVFGLNGTFAWFRLALTNPICFLPLVLLGIEVARERVQQGRRTHWWIVAGGLGLSLVAGFPETAYLDGLFAGVWALARTFGLPRIHLRRYLTAIIGAAIAGIALAVPVLVPFADYLPSSYLAGNSGDISHAHIATQGLADLFFPYIYGPILGFSSTTNSSALQVLWLSTGGYLTVAVILLAIFGLFDKDHRPLKVALAAWCILFVARSYGNPDAENVLSLVPGLAHVLTYRYMGPSVELAMAVLAAFGVRNVLEERARRSQFLSAAAGVVVVALIVATEAHQFAGSILGDRTWEKASLLWAFGTLALVAAIIASPVLRRFGMILLIAILPIEAVAMLVTPEFAAPRGGHVDAALVHFLQDHIGSDRVFTLGAALEANYGSYFGVASLDVNDLPVPKIFENLVREKLDPNVYPAVFTGWASLSPTGMTPEAAFIRYAKNYEALGVKYLLIAANTPPPIIPGTTLSLAYQDPIATVYLLPHVGTYFEDTTPNCKIRVVTEEKAEVRCPEPSVLLRNELAIPGWTIRVDEHEEPMGTSELAQETVDIPAGSHTVTYSFRPAHVGLAWLAVLSALGACIVSTGLPSRLTLHRSFRRRPGNHRRSPRSRR
jgi:hypothetical protein